MRGHEVLPEELVTICLEIIRPALPLLVVVFLGSGIFNGFSSQEMERARHSEYTKPITAGRSEEEKRKLLEWEEKRKQKEQQRALDALYK